MEARKFRSASIDNRLPLLHEAPGNPFPNSRSEPLWLHDAPTAWIISWAPGLCLDGSKLLPEARRGLLSQGSHKRRRWSTFTLARGCRALAFACS